jgi:transcriptional regulator with XRE-family HTH domain
MLVIKTPREHQKELGGKIKNARKKQGLYTQKEFAKKANIPISTYQRLEQLGEGSIKDLVAALIILGESDTLEQFLKEEASLEDEYNKKNKKLKEYHL